MSQQVLIRRVAWIIYAVVYLYFTISQNLAQYNYNGSSLLLFMNSIIPVAMAYAIYGHAFDKGFMERMIWRFVFWILFLRFIFVAVDSISEYRQMYDYLELHGAQIEISEINDLYFFLMLFIPLPGLYVLYRYSEVDNPIWVQRERNDHLRFANQLFNHKPKATAYLTTEEGEGMSCIAVLERTVDGFELTLTITENDQTRTENHKFETAIQALEYIEENTPLSMYEFE